MKKLLINKENLNGIYVDLTAEELAQRDTDIANLEAENTAKANEEQAQADLKASAKAKLMAGEPMTEEEANLTLHIN